MLMRIIDKVNKIVSKFYKSRHGIKAAFFLWALLLILSGFQLINLKFDFDFENFFPNDHPDLKVFEEFKSKYNYDNDFLLIAILNEKGIFNQHFLTKVNKSVGQIKKQKGSISVLSPLDVKFPVKTPLGFISYSILHPESPQKLLKDSLRISKKASVENYFLGKNKKSIVVKIQHEHFVDLGISNKYVKNIESILEKNGLTNYHLVGRTSVQSEFVGLIQSDFGVFIGLAFLIIFIFLRWQYRNFLSLLIPMILILSTIVVTLGIMTFMGYSLNILTVLIPTIISFVAISDVIHFYTKYQLTFATETDKKQALLLTIKSIGPATFLTSLTTAIGFISLATIYVLPIQLLGIFTAIGVSIAFVFTFILLPFFAKSFNLVNHMNGNQWGNLSNWCFRLVLKFPKQIIGISILVFIISVFGALKMNIDAYLLDDLPDNSPAKKSFTYFDKEHGGTKPWNLYIELKDSVSQFNYANLTRLNQIESYLIEIYGLTNINSPIQQLKLLNQISAGGHAKYYNFPMDEKSYLKLIMLGKKLSARFSFPPIDNQLRQTKISGFIPEWGSKKTSDKDQLLLKFINENIPQNELDFEITGTTYLIDRSHEFLSKNLFSGLLIAFGTVGLLSMFLFKSFKMIVVTLIPNLLPVLMTAAVIGYLGIPIKLTTSIIFAISFGIAVDDTIHFISSFRAELRKHSTIDAVKNSFQSAGKAIILTTILLGLGFGIFCFSSFGATFFTGFFIVLTLLFALFVDLFLLPVLLIKFYNKKQSRSS